MRSRPRGGWLPPRSASRRRDTWRAAARRGSTPVSCHWAMPRSRFWESSKGLTELMPISSTAHMRIVPAVLGWQDPWFGLLGRHAARRARGRHHLFLAGRQRHCGGVQSALWHERPIRCLGVSLRGLGRVGDHSHRRRGPASFVAIEQLRVAAARAGGRGRRLHRHGGSAGHRGALLPAPPRSWAT